VISDKELVERMHALLAGRAQDKSICPSDVARSFGLPEDAWRALMPRIRELAQHQADQGHLRVTQGSAQALRDVNALQARGPLRLRKNS
jgi:Protein of unknown function (DUF3253)